MVPVHYLEQLLWIPCIKLHVSEFAVNFPL